MHGHMHNAAYLSYFEGAISDFLRQVGLSSEFAPDGAFVYHVRKAGVTFEAPTRYEDKIQIFCAPGHLGRSSLRFDGRFLGADGDLRATADVVWICVDRSTGTPCNLPDIVRDGLAPYLTASGPS
ncbi:thioesterase [Thalassococcus sp. S3]|nr:thioesterase [Thalassococcus sp. S3]